jgi:hypothetical protein
MMKYFKRYFRLRLYIRGLHAPVIGELNTLSDILDRVYVEGGFMPL